MSRTPPSPTNAPSTDPPVEPTAGTDEPAASGTDEPAASGTDEPTASKADARRQGRRVMRAFGWTLAVVLAAALLAAGGSAVATASTTDTSGIDRGADASALDGDALAGAHPQVNASFSREMYETTVGDPVELSVVVDGETYLLVGGNRLSDSGNSVGFTDVIRLRPGGDGDRMDLTLNTRIAGTGEDYVSVADDGGSATSCSVGSCSVDLVDEDGEELVDENGDARELSDVPTATGAGGLSRPLAPARYRLSAVENATFTVTTGGEVSPAAPSERSDLVLVEPDRHLGAEVDLFTSLPAESDEEIDSLGALRGDGLDRSAVTKGDRLVVGVEAAGIWGALSHLADDDGAIAADTNATGEVLSDLFTKEEGIGMRIDQTNPKPNRAPTRIGPAEIEDATVLFESADEIEPAAADPSAGAFYLVIDTSDGDPIGERFEPGEEYRIEFELDGERGDRYRFADDADGPFDAASVGDDSVPEQFPYLSADDEGVSASTTFSVTERYLRYDHATGDGEILVDDGQVTGTTTLLPATELSGEFTYDGGDTPEVSESTVTVDDGGNFSIDLGLSDVSTGDRVLFELYDDAGSRDSRTVVVADDAADPGRLRLADTTTNLTVTRGDSLSSLSTTVRNVGVLESRDRLSLDVADGEIVEETRVTLGPGASHNETFADVDIDLDPGQYSYALSIDGDVAEGTLTVEADPAVTHVDAEGNETDDADDDESVSEPRAQDDDSGADDADSGADDTDSGADDADSDAGTSPDDPDSSADADGTDDGAGDTDDASADEEDPPPDDTPATLLPFGIGTREAFGGTVLVGATYLLGHWV